MSFKEENRPGSGYYQPGEGEDAISPTFEPTLAPPMREGLQDLRLHDQRLRLFPKGLEGLGSVSLVVKAQPLFIGKVCDERVLPEGIETLTGRGVPHNGQRTAEACAICKMNGSR